MLHKIRAQNKSTGYVLAYSQNPKKTVEIVQTPSWKILQNDAKIQAVSFTDGLLMAAFFSPGALQTTEHYNLTVDKPCLILVSKDALYVSDPAHIGGAVKINLKMEDLQKLICLLMERRLKQSYSRLFYSLMMNRCHQKSITKSSIKVFCPLTYKLIFPDLRPGCCREIVSLLFLPKGSLWIFERRRVGN